MVWVLTTLFRLVAWTFTQQVWWVVRMNVGMCFEFIARYQDVLRSPELQQLSGPSYAYALWSVLFTVPVELLAEFDDDYGRYGRMVRSWWLALQTTLGDYVPGLVVRTLHSLRRYYRAYFDASKDTWGRVRADVLGLCWVVALLLSTAFHLPTVIYDLVEFVCCGTLDVAIGAVVMNNCISWV
ncbi:hypothetical protein PHMEG_00025724 [Phytophthora megakarya]|uniref:Uncharacterized protein n=1 Tax=Phytophthora megakarya TaxID=4795 RepID=A0A225VBH6_9STRA|nr:hypothetical protein PHMEG_00025724 [Phytophthora megakarya]